jgi:hypothetical protein
VFEGVREAEGIDAAVKRSVALYFKDVKADIRISHQVDGLPLTAAADPSEIESNWLAHMGRAGTAGRSGLQRGLRESGHCGGKKAFSPVPADIEIRPGPGIEAFAEFLAAGGLPGGTMRATNRRGWAPDDSADHGGQLAEAGEWQDRSIPGRIDSQPCGLRVSVPGDSRVSPEVAQPPAKVGKSMVRRLVSLYHTALVGGTNPIARIAVDGNHRDSAGECPGRRLGKAKGFARLVRRLSGLRGAPFPQLKEEANDAESTHFGRGGDAHTTLGIHKNGSHGLLR